MSIVRWYCGKCKKEFVDCARNPSLKPECPICKGETNYEEVFELETL